MKDLKAGVYDGWENGAGLISNSVTHAAGSQSAGWNVFAMTGTLAANSFPTIAEEARMVDISTPFGDFSPMILVAIVLPVVIYLLLFRTKLGLKIRAVGENPQAADVAGIKIHLLRLLSTATGASLAGLAGAYLSIDWIGSVTKELSAGRGFIALATVVFSGLNPLLVLLGGFIFGFFDNLAVWVATMPAVQQIIPWQFVSMAPYVVTLMVAAGVIGRVRFPAAMGVPYERE